MFCSVPFSYLNPSPWFCRTCPLRDKTLHFHIFWYKLKLFLLFFILENKKNKQFGKKNNITCIFMSERITCDSKGKPMCLSILHYIMRYKISGLVILIKQPEIGLTYSYWKIEIKLLKRKIDLARLNRFLWWFSQYFHTEIWYKSLPSHSHWRMTSSITTCTKSLGPTSIAPKISPCHNWK